MQVKQKSSKNFHFHNKLLYFFFVNIQMFRREVKHTATILGLQLRAQIIIFLVDSQQPKSNKIKSLFKWHSIQFYARECELSVQQSQGRDLFFRRNTLQVVNPLYVRRSSRRLGTRHNEFTHNRGFACSGWRRSRIVAIKTDSDFRVLAWLDAVTLFSDIERRVVDLERKRRQVWEDVTECY